MCNLRKCYTRYCDDLPDDLPEDLPDDLPDDLPEDLPDDLPDISLLAIVLGLLLFMEVCFYTVYCIYHIW